MQFEDDEPGQEAAGRRHRVLVSGPDGVVPASLAAAVDLVTAPVPADEMAPTSFAWLDIVAPAEEDAKFLRETLGFHPLPVEDALFGKQFPKIERYPGYLFMVLYAARINPERNRPAFYELHCFVGRQYLVTVRQESMREVRHVMARWRGAAEHFPSVGHLTHALADALVDSYFPMVDHFSARVAATESEVYEKPQEAMQNIMSLRRELLRFRGLMGPTRDVLTSMLRRDLPFLNPDLLPYFMEVRDHAVRVSEEIDMLRDLLSTAVEAQFTVTSNQLNQTMRMLTAWSIILMSSTLVAGIYGMNFVLMPELEWRHGYPMALGLMLAIAGLLLLFFKRRRWI